jgi:hypothetical protein
MSPVVLEALVLLTAEAIKGGIQISHILREAKEQGQISDETWTAILLDIDQAEDLWVLAGEPDGDE